ncbi:MAG TPA: hypothetical protein VK442_00215, partial [Xanthobacteraceae bacterium]|nr:hypothetical protein [Xanthobacteraceae bacterium]
ELTATTLQEYSRQPSRGLIDCGRNTLRAAGPDYAIQQIAVLRCRRGSFASFLALGLDVGFGFQLADIGWSRLSR